MAYLLLRPYVIPIIGRCWLKQRSTNFELIAREQGIDFSVCKVDDVASVAGIKEVIATGQDVNAYIAHAEADDPSLRSKSGFDTRFDRFTMLTLACFHGHEDAVDYLLAQDGIQVNKGSMHQNWTPLFVAAMRGDASVVQKLIARGADVHARTEDGQNALLVATAHGHAVVVQMLMEGGARRSSLWMGLRPSGAVDSADEAFGWLDTPTALIYISILDTQTAK